MGEPCTALRAGLAAICVAVLATLLLPAANGADSPSKLRERAQTLRAQNGSLSTQAEAAWLSSASLGTRLEQTRAALVRLHARTQAIAGERAEAEESLRLARRTIAVSQERLADRLRVLYEQEDADPMAVLVGAESLDDAISGLENLHRVAVQYRVVIEQAEAERARLVRATRRLAEQEAQARQTEAATAATVAALDAARRERESLVASLTAKRNSNARTLSSLGSQLAAGQAQRPTTELSGAVAGTNSMTVTATGYSLTGKTATGVPVGYGIVAVDPAVIPLGTHMTVPGYGEGVAADTGGSVGGSRIDLWFPTRAEALAWGTRTVTITLH